MGGKSSWGRDSSRAAADFPLSAGGAPVRVILADSQAIFRVGIAKVLMAEPGISVVAQAETLGEAVAALARYPAEVLFLEQALFPTPAEAVVEILKRNPQLFVAVLVTHPTERETVELLRAGARGIVTRGIAPELLVRCVRKIAEGETWLDHREVNWLIKAFQNQSVQLRSANGRPVLTEKEMMVVAGVTQGLRNRDIAQEMGATEQVIKNYLRKIYSKLGISDRLELALYTVNEHLLEREGQKPPPPVTEAAASAGVIRVHQR